MPNGKQQDSGTTAGSYPISRTFAFLVLAALAFLVLIRHLYGTITVSAGTK